MKVFILIWAFIGETIPLLFLYFERYFQTTSSFLRVELVLWPLSILLMATGPDPRTGAPKPAIDDGILACSILLNMLLYVVIGLILWSFRFLFLKCRMGLSLRTED